MMILRASFTGDGRIMMDWDDPRDPSDISSGPDLMSIDFFASLPGAKFSIQKRGFRTWTCKLTPATCYRILYDAPGSVAITSEDGIYDVANEFLRSIGDAPAIQPAIRKMDAWNHQALAYSFARQRKASLLNMGMGTGKSAVAINVLQNDPESKTILILCPLSVRSVWRREFLKHCSIEHDLLILEKGTTKQKADKAKTFLEMSELRGVTAVIVVNYDTAKLEPFAKWSQSFEWGCIIADESHRAKSPSSVTSKYLSRLRGKRKMCLTGTPMPHGPLDIFGQFRFLDSGIYGDSYHRFRSKYAISGVFGSDHIIAYKNQDDLANKMSLMTYTVGRDVLDLPPVTHNVRTCDLSASSKKVYKEMETELIAFVGDGNHATASNGLVKILRLQQITSGHIKDSEEVVRTIGTEKIDILEEILDEIGPTGKVVVFCNFIHDLDSVAKLCLDNGIYYGELSGRRKDLTEHAQIPAGVMVLGVQYQAGGVGVDLTGASYCVFFSATYNGGNYEQALARTHRPGQSKNVVYYHILCLESVDVTIYRALRSKRDVVSAVIGSLAGDLDGYDEGDDLGLGTVCGSKRRSSGVRAT